MRKPGHASWRTVVAVGLSALSILPSSGSARASTCPPNTIGFPNGPILVTSTDAARDTTVQSGARGAWDLAIGELRVAVYDRTGIEVTCEDIYWLEGVPSESSTPFEARFEVSGDFAGGGWDGHDPCSGSAWNFSVAEGTNLASDFYAFNCFSGSGHVDRAAILTLAKAADEPFTLRLSLASTVSYRDLASVVGRIHFIGLPPGARVVSCQGFTSSGTTSSRRSSWGLVKAAYR